MEKVNDIAKKLWSISPQLCLILKRDPVIMEIPNYDTLLELSIKPLKSNSRPELHMQTSFTFWQSSDFLKSSGFNSVFKNNKTSYHWHSVSFYFTVKFLKRFYTSLLVHITKNTNKSNNQKNGL